MVENEMKIVKYLCWWKSKDRERGVCVKCVFFWDDWKYFCNKICEENFDVLCMGWKDKKLFLNILMGERWRKIELCS